MEYEWYSGSDIDGRVSRRLLEYVNSSDDLPASQRILELESIYPLERDRNWRGHISFLIGAEYYLESEIQTALGFFHRALREFDVLMENFEDVVSSYCKSQLYILREELSEATDPRRTAEWGMAILPWLDKADFSDYEISLLMTNLGFAFAELSEQSGMEFLDQLAFSVRNRAFHIDRSDVDKIEFLFLSALATKERDFCSQLLDLIGALESGTPLLTKARGLFQRVFPS